jgi:hypothetical protein
MTTQGTANTNLVKSPYKKETFTTDQLTELAKCANDPKYFMTEHCWIQHPTKGRMKFDLFDFQRELVDTYHDYRSSIALISRQMGKSTAAAGYLLWYAMFNPDQTILIAAHKYSGAQEIMQRIRFAYETLPDYIRAGATSYNKGSLEFDNGSRIIAQATTDNTGRGLSISLAYLDEFAFVRPTIAREFWTALSPTLSTGGKCIITSTPNQDDDQFAQIWRDANKCLDEYGNETETGINGFRGYSADWKKHPDRDQKWADEEKGKIGEERFRREHLNEFIAFDETLIDSIKLTLLEGKDPYAKQGQVRWFKPVQPGKIYMVALDPSLGTGGDNAAIQVYELPGMKQVAEWQHNKTSIQHQIRIVKQILELIEKDSNETAEIYYSIENNTLGEAALVVVEEIGEENIPGTFLSEPKKRGNNTKLRRGFTTTHKSKLAACAKLKHWVETDKIEIASKNLLRELKTFVARGSSFSAKDGEKDDLVMALVLITRMAQEITKYEESAFDYLGTNDDDDDYDEPMPMSFL